MARTFKVGDKIAYRGNVHRIGTVVKVSRDRQTLTIAWTVKGLPREIPAKDATFIDDRY